jgi:hypothetical protein
MGVESEGRAWDGRSLLPVISGNKEEIRDHALIDETEAC